MSCPYCGASAYVSAFFVECSNEKCEHYCPPKFEEKIITIEGEDFKLVKVPGKLSKADGPAVEDKDYPHTPWYVMGKDHTKTKPAKIID